MPDQRKILVTSALPYVNGSPHMGHLVEYIQTDIWVRFQKLRGHDCIYVCASDAHGTPIMLKARELGITPEELTEGFAKEFVNDFADFHIEFDNYHTTHSPENEALVIEMFEALRATGDVYTKTIEQAYDEKEGMFLPDRFVRGIARSAKQKTSMAMPARTAARPIRQPTSSTQYRWSRARRPCARSPNTISSS